MTFYCDINKLYNRKLIFNSKYDLIIVNISFHFYQYFIGLEKFVLSYNPLLNFVNYAPII